MKAFNRQAIEEFRANGGKFSGPMEGRQLLVLTTTGSRSGEPRSVVVGYRRDGERHLVIASNNGNDSAPHWYFNLRANPIVTVEVGSEKFQARARVADRDERMKLADRFDYLAGQQALTRREIPIVVLERT